MMTNSSAFFLPLSAQTGHPPSRLPHQFVALCLCLLTTFSVSASSDIWVCTDPETGAKTYTGKPRNTRNCRSTGIGSGTAPPTAGARAAAPASTASGARPAGVTTARTASDRPAFTPESRARDSDRKQILQEELDAENRKLAELQREFNNGTPVRRPEETDHAKFADRKQRLSSELERTRINVRTLERELGRL